MKQPKQQAKQGRRAFLAGAVTAGSAAAVIAASGEAAAETTSVDTSSKAKSSGYQETEHVRDYYNTARI